MIPKGFKPQLAASLTMPEAIQYPVYASPKIDGVRCVIFGGVAYAARSMNPFPNPVIQEWAAKHADVLERLDGELVVGEATAPDCLRVTIKGIAPKRTPDFSFHVFDIVEGGVPFASRYECYSVLLVDPQSIALERTLAVEQTLIHDAEQLEAYEAEMLALGYEGIMIRNPAAPYKFGRSGEQEGRGKVKTQGAMIKVKRFEDAEAVVIGFEEEMHNANPAKKDAFGRTERSTHKANMHGKGILGKLVGKQADGTIVKAAGFTKDDKIDLWASRHLLLGRTFTFKHFPHGAKDKLRHTTFKCFRDPLDLPQ